MIKVGITGGIGSGKTTVCKIFATLGIPVYNADNRAKELMVSDANIVREVKKIFGEVAYNDEGQLNRKFISDRVFNNQQLLVQLNAIVHPAVFQDTFLWFQNHLDKPYTLYEAAILFETGNYKMLDKTITVFAPAEDRIVRTIKRDNVSRSEVLERMDKQMAEEEKIKLADYVIYNDHSKPLIEQVLKIHQELLLISK